MQIESYIKTNKVFVPVDEFCAPLADPEHIEGAIVLTINDVELITQEMWDYVDQLWEYLVDAVLGAAEGREVTFFFPDQPIEVKVRPVWNGRGIDLEVRRRAVWRRTSTSMQEFTSRLCDAGEKFFRKMRQANPSNKNADEQVLAKLLKLRSAVR